MTKKKYTVDEFIADFPCGFEDLQGNTCEVFCDDNRMTYREVVDKLNKLHEENNELKEEVQLLKDGMKAYENAIPYVCTCGQVSDINSEMFDFRMKQNKFYKEHPNRCTVIIDGVRYE